MKYFKKFFFLVLFVFFGLSFCNAGEYTLTGTIATSNEVYSYTDLIYFPVPLKHYYEIGNIDLTCTFNNLIGYTDIPISLTYIYVNSKGTNSFYGENYHITENSTAIFNYRGLNQNAIIGYRFRPNTTIDNAFSFDFSCTVSGNNVIGLGGNTCDYSGYVLESNITQNYCVNKYQNLIPEEDITSSYCEVEFGLIDPLNCPSSPSGSGDVQWSALYVDNVQYIGAPNIYVNVSDILDYSMTYVSGSAVIDVDGYKYDTGYMADILTVQEYHPSSEDFTVAFVSFLTLGLPYVVVILFVAFVRKLIKKIFKF